METTPDTVNYLIAGYVVFAIIMSLYLVSLYQRWRSLQNDLRSLDETEKK
jgi:cell division protein FtsL